MPEVLIGKGRTGKVYRLDENPETVVRKEFDPSYTARVWNWFFYSSAHPLSNGTGVTYAYWKRRLANRLGKSITDGITIVDALGPSYKGFTSPFIDGHKPTKQDIERIQSQVDRLEQVFDDSGMPTWSFGRRNPLSASNFIMRDGEVYIVDYEQSVAIPDVRGNMGYDRVYFDDVYHFIDDKKLNILNRLGGEETQSLYEAFELSRQAYTKLDMTPRKATKFGERFSRTLNNRNIDSLVEELHRESKITDEEFDSYRTGKVGETIGLVLPNLGLHCAIGIVTPTGIGAPISSALRFGWTAFNWTYYAMKGDDKRKIHGPKVMFVSLVPGLGNFAYVIPIMEANQRIGKELGRQLTHELFSF
ncbi:MAG: hypothetical protein HYW22_00395 [Candidatus Aenigmarchaeota archaeon]|nr:hypothetical protein [Candidatus Aenigmarchaeota archaeon]